MYQTQRNPQTRRFWVGLLLVAGMVGVATHFDLIGHLAYAVEKGRLRATAEELARVEQADRVIGMVAEMVTPAVVNIRTVVSGKAEEEPEGELSPEEIPEPLRRFFGPGFQWPERFRMPPDPRPQRGMGSGVIFDADKGLVLTNNHVIENADSIKVRLWDRREMHAELVGTDPKTDLAVIKIKPDRLHALELGDSDEAFVGSTVLAVGAPFQYEQTVTKGIISAKKRTGVIASLEYENFIQTDAAINPGNSGGPLVNLRGEVIGLNTAIATNGRVGAYMGIGFAIPSNMIKHYLPQLVEGKPIVRGYLGVVIQSLTDNPGLAEALGFDENRGALIGSVQPGGPADQCGLRQGDIVIGFDGIRIETVPQFSQRVAMTRPGTSVDINVWRDGREVTLRATIGEQPEGFSTKIGRGGNPFRDLSPRTEVVEDLGISVSDLTGELSREHGWDRDDDHGVIVTAVKPGSEAEGALVVGSLITQIGVRGDGEKAEMMDVRDIRDFRRYMEGQSLEKGIVFYVKTKDGEITRGSFVFLKVE